MSSESMAIGALAMDVTTRRVQDYHASIGATIESFPRLLQSTGGWPETRRKYPRMPDPFSAAFVRGIDANRTLRDELTAAIRTQSTRRRISVTDLVNPRQAFFRWTRPEIQPSPDRAHFMLAGTGFHDLFGRTVSTEEFVEQFVEHEGVVGKIDIYEDLPVELKTTGSNPDAPGAARPGYIDQLGMYCTITGVSSGRLLIYRREQFGRQPALRALRLCFLLF